MRSRNTLLMAIAVGLLATAVYFLEIRGAEERAEEEAVAGRLLRFESADVTGLTIERGDGSVTLAATDGEWAITAPYALAADQAAVTGIVNQIQRADRERVVDEAPEDLGRFGLAEPEFSATLSFADGSTSTLAFGDGTPVGASVFVKTGDADAVYMAAATLKDAVGKELFDLRDRSVMTFADADITRVEIATDDLDATVERQPQLGDGIIRWGLTAPLEARGDADTVAGILTRLRTDSAVGVATDEPTDEQLAEYGVEDSGAAIKLWTADNQLQTLIIGGESEEPAGRYARRLGDDTVMVVPTTLVDAIPTDVAELRNRTVVEFARDRVNAIDISGDETLRLDKVGIDWVISAPRQLGADAAAASALLSGALGLRARTFPSGDASDATFGFASPYRRLSFELEALPGDDTGAGQDAETVVVTIGSETEVPGEGDDAEPLSARFVTVEGDPTVFTVASDDLGDVEVDMFALRSKTLVSFGQSELTGIDLTAGDTSFELRKDEAGAWTSAGAPVDEATARAIDDMLWRLNYLDMQGVVTETADPDLNPYGLASPSFAVTAYIGDQTVADLQIGGDVAEEDTGDVPAFGPQVQNYATVATTPGVFRIGSNLRDAVQALVDALD